jgi:hypothetical protein
VPEGGEYSQPPMKPSDYICWTLRDRKNLRVPQMALRRSRGRGWIELADRGSVESVARDVCTTWLIFIIMLS